jgi:hypothetical protein
VVATTRLLPILEFHGWFLVTVSNASGQWLWRVSSCAIFFGRAAVGLAAICVNRRSCDVPCMLPQRIFMDGVREHSLFVWLISYERKYCWLICCEKKILLKDFVEAS